MCDSDLFGWCIDGEAYFAALRDVLDHARREILIVGWDVDSRFELVRDDDHRHHPSPLCRVLQERVRQTGDLCVRVLSWDFALVFALERELMPARAFGWKNSERLHFRLDDQHASGASHHQKIVVIDGAIAFVGGLDLTKCRWDTRRHLAADARRKDPNGETYPPFHDVQAVVSGDAAAALRELVSERWRNATGSALPAIQPVCDGKALWPERVGRRASAARVAIARTWCDPNGDGDVREVEQLYLDCIAQARRSIYIENQYFTSVSVSEALAARLAERDGPEVVIVLPARTSGWLEQATMDVLRNRAIARVRKADQFGRLRIVSPVSDELGDATITVHAKVMVVDNAIARIGSANLSRRSMNLDSECDLAIIDQEAAIALCADLLSEHLGAGFDDVVESLADAGLLATLDRFGGNARRLAALEIDAGEMEQAVLEPVAKIADLEKPILRPEPGSDAAAPSQSMAGWLSLAGIALVLGFWACLAVLGSGGDLSLRSLLAALRDVAGHPFAPLAVLPVFVAGSLVVAPVTGLIALCALLFDPWVAAVSATAGTLAATAVNHWLGSRFHEALMYRIPDAVTDRIGRLASSSDAWALAGLRLIPIAPFTFVNLAVGALGIELRAFIAGTLVAMTPGIVVICLSVDRARAAFAGEPIFDPWIVVGIAVAGAAMIALRLWRKRNAPSSDGE
ncbi:MAG: phospholipase D-like domain-containing protein [Gammaproteobacteria bacterium]